MSVRESAATTLRDWFILLIGVALGIVGWAAMARRAPELVVYNGLVCNFRPVSWNPEFGLAWGIALGTELTILSRRTVFGGSPRPAEWLAILLAVQFINLTLLDPEPDIIAFWVTNRMQVDWSGLGFPMSMEILRPRIDGGPATAVGRFTLVSLLLAALTVIARRRLPAWLSVVVLTMAALAALAGPARWWESVCGGMPRFWPSPPAGSLLDSRVWSRWEFDLKFLAPPLLGLWPRAALLVTAAVLAIGRRGRADGSARLWTEWGGVAASLILAAGWLFDELVRRPEPSVAVRLTAVSVWGFTLLLPGLLLRRRLAGVRLPRGSTTME
jgi:hypothetical protein